MSVVGTSSTTTSKSKKRKLDIEQALSWAFREELPKAQADRRISAAPTMSVHPMWRAGVFGARIDNWNNVDPGFPAAMGEPHPDAVLIGNAVKGCDVDKLDLWGFDVPYKIGENYDQAGLMEKARRETIAVMTNCATSRTRPDTSDQVTVVAVRSVTGQITVWVREAREYEDAQGKPIIVEHDLPTKPVRKGTYPTGAFCKIQYAPSAATVALDRLRYAGWWAGLQQVAEHLRVMGLSSIELEGLSAPRSPWTEAYEAPEATVPPLPNLAPRTEVLKDRRVAGRRQRPRRNSEVRHIYHRGTDAPAETA
ncbi:hypothetical protein [Methylobacterium gnaphalii]|uniref:Uncharacterized protein n=1 Tax=Methylobacterium gnaphalii TaxID=1010610 RepID=A0A512JIR4_9HYPH|nr:hypothetical protein [Methylobacterium gnaphalii]GEP09841.1 hypothetical protein MGN01_16860 [Methylobacterium gnaphalii]GJD67244.1 hypothetical protein MMMDOFMJ_0158 [Methylobacterium gnaphalii]GLS49870.1 hypothetical protein GCM10007885_27220 [Methylobacterium gnaphalii]